MQAFSRAWRIDSDAIYCKCCKRGIVQSRDGEEFNHRAGCTNKASHPWAVLSAIISTPIATAPKESRIYLSGPMTGLPDLNFPAFHAEAARLRGLGWDVVNPAELNPDPKADWVSCMRVDIAALMTCGAIALLPGYDESKGASLELHIARWLNYSVINSYDIVSRIGRSSVAESKGCQGTNCGTTDFNHSTECRAEHEAACGGVA